MELIDKIKAVAKEGVDFSEIEREIANSNPLKDVIDKESAWKFIKNNDLLLRVFDTKVNERGETTLENFKSSKLEAILKEREDAIRQEFNKDETPEQMQIRELIEKDRARDAEIARRDLQDSLSVKAKELGFDPIRAKNYAVFGEDALLRLEEDANWFKQSVEERVGKEIKENYGGIKQPKQAKIDPIDIDSKIREARSKGDFTTALRLQIDKDKPTG